MYRLRFIFVMLPCLFRKPKGLLEEFRLRFWVIPGIDTDVTRAFTHAYSAWGALARWHLMFRCEFRKVVLKNQWTPITTAENIRYLRSARAFQRVELRTRIVYWDERRFFLRHEFLVGGGVVAESLVEGLIRAPGSTVRPQEAFDSVGVERTSPAITSELEAWIKYLESERV